MGARLKKQAVRTKARESGFALTQLLVLVSLASVSVIFVSKSLAVSFKSTRAVSEKIDFSFLKQHIQKISCTETLPSKTCSPGSLVELRYKNSSGAAQILVSANASAPTRIGAYTLRAECGVSGEGLVVRASRLKVGRALTASAKTDFLPEPVLNKVFTWTEPQTLLTPTGLELCSGSSNASGTKQISKSELSNFTNSSTKTTTLIEHRAGKNYLLDFSSLREPGNGNPLLVCCKSGSIALGMGGTMSGSGGNDSMLRSWPAANGRCMNFCEKTCNGESWARVWLSCGEPSPGGNQN